MPESTPPVVLDTALRCVPDCQLRQWLEVLRLQLLQCEASAGITSCPCVFGQLSAKRAELGATSDCGSNHRNCSSCSHSLSLNQQINAHSVPSRLEQGTTSMCDIYIYISGLRRPGAEELSSLNLLAYARLDSTVQMLTSSSECIFNVAQTSPRKAASGTSCSVAYRKASATTAGGRLGDTRGAPWRSYTASPCRNTPGPDCDTTRPSPAAREVLVLAVVHHLLGHAGSCRPYTARPSPAARQFVAASDQ